MLPTHKTNDPHPLFRVWAKRLGKTKLLLGFPIRFTIRDRGYGPWLSVFCLERPAANHLGELPVPHQFNPYHEWLGLDQSLTAPNYFQLLGVDPDEEDAERLAAAASEALARVRRHRPGSHAKQWADLLDEITAAKVCLIDPRARRVYLRQLQSATAAPAVTRGEAAPVLAQADAARAAADASPVVPATDPMAPYQAGAPVAAGPGSLGPNATANHTPPTPPPAPPPVVQAPSQAAEAPRPTAAPETQAASATAPRQIVRRRRVVPMTSFVFCVVCLLVAVVALFPYFKSGEGQHRIRQLLVSFGLQRPVEEQVAQRPVDELPLEPVEPDQSAAEPSESPLPDADQLDPLPQLPFDMQPSAEKPAPDAPETPEPETPSTTPVEPKPEPSDPAPKPNESTPGEKPPADPGPPDTTVPAKPEGDSPEEPLKAAENALLALDFATFQQHVVVAEQSSVSEDQKQFIGRLKKLAECAQRFEQAINEAPNSVGAGTEIQVGDSNIISVVELSSDRIVVRLAGQNRRFTWENVPLGLAVALGEHVMGRDDPQTRLCKAAYVAVCPRTDERSFSRALEWLEELSAELPEAADMLEVIKTLQQELDASS